MKINRRTKRAARALFHVCLIDGALDEGRARFVAGRLAASTQRGTLGVLLHFQRLVRLDRDRYTASVESATPLAGGLRARVEQRLAGVYGPALATTFTANPALIGGLRIRVGSHVYDGSVRARLAALEARL